MSGLRVMIGLGAAGFVGLVIWAIGAAPFGASFDRILADPWGIVTLADLYLGFLIAAVIIWSFEANRGTALLWIVPMFFLGNAVTAAWLVLRLPEIARRVGRLSVP